MTEAQIEKFTKFYFQIKNIANLKDIANILIIPKPIMEKFANLNLLTNQTSLQNENEIDCLQCKQRVNSRIPSCNHPICIECYLTRLKSISHFTFFNFDEVKCPICNVIIDPKLIFNCLQSFIKYVEFYPQDFLEVATYNCIKCKTGNATIVIKNDSEILHCNSCSFDICRKCKSDHTGTTCQDFQSTVKINSEIMMSFSAHAIVALAMNYCHYCLSLYDKIGGCNHMACSKNSQNWCLLCSSKLDSNYGVHWSNGGFNSNDHACTEFPKKLCPSCTYITVRQGKMNQINCPKCHNNWCFLCQKLIDNGNPDSHYNGHSNTGSTCPNMPNKACPYCNNPHSTKEGSILGICSANNNLYCYLCSTKFNTSKRDKNAEIGKHFSDYGLYNPYCINLKPY